jgi:HD-GYP domain-containing protein (c-di-GMP phosphodiesterase class II)
MKRRKLGERIVFEVMLVVVTIGMTFLLYRMGGYKMVVLNLFFLPIVLSGYFLGRTNAGLLALFSVLAVTVATTLDSTGLAAYSTPVMVGLALTVWAAALGLTAILVGTLCDERAKTVEELHVAYVGVVEVLSKYLQNADPEVKARSTRVAELSQAVAVEMRLSRKRIDDVRVGALLYDIGNVEVTTQLLTKAVDTLEANSAKTKSYTFSGEDLVHSLGLVLSGALPLLLNQDEAVLECRLTGEDAPVRDVPIGAKIIRAARAYDALVAGESDRRAMSPPDAVQELRKDVSGAFSPDVLDAIEHCTSRSGKRSSPKPAYV